MAERQGLLDQHEDRQPTNPEQVHHAAEKQQRHQEPAAAEAVGAVLQAHAEGAKPPPRRQLVRKLSGVRQWRRQTVLTGVSCQARRRSGSRRRARVVVAIIGDSSRAAPTPIAAPTAAALKPPHGDQIAERRTIRSALRSAAGRSLWRLTRANSSSIGAALGSIIATIITHHIENISAA